MQTHFRVSNLYNVWRWNFLWLGMVIQNGSLNFANKDIIFCWVPSDIGIRGNKKADFAAKSVLDLACGKFSVPYTDLKQHISQYILSTW